MLITQKECLKYVLRERERENIFIELHVAQGTVVAAGLCRAATSAALVTKQVCTSRSELPSASSHCSSEEIRGKGSLGHPQKMWGRVARAPHAGHSGEGYNEGWIRWSIAGLGNVFV